MVASFNGKPPVKNTGANKPSGQPVSPPVKKIESAASRAKARGGSANAGSGIGNS
jgi:hypothetical protein